MFKANKKRLVVIPNKQMRLIRANIEQIHKSDQKIIFLTSPLDNQKQNVIAGSLAASFAETGKQVLLVDAKINAPFLHTYHGLENEEGFLEILQGRMPVWHHTPVSGLYIMTAGTANAMTRRAWTTANLEYAVKKLSASFDVIVFNAPAYLETAEARMLSDICDHHLLVVTKNKTKAEQLVKVKTTLDRSGKKLTGAIYEAG